MTQHTQTKTVDLHDEIESLDTEIDDIIDEAESLAEDSDEYEQLDVEYKALAMKQQQYESLIEQIGGSVFKIRELSFGEMMHIRDQVKAKSEDPQNPREGLYKTLILDKAVVDQPAGIDSDAKQWPETLGEWVYNEVDMMNSGVDEEALGNLSLAEEMERRETTQ